MVQLKFLDNWNQIYVLGILFGSRLGHSFPEWFTKNRRMFSLATLMSDQNMTTVNTMVYVSISFSFGFWVSSRWLWDFTLNFIIVLPQTDFSITIRLPSKPSCVLGLCLRRIAMYFVVFNRGSTWRSFRDVWLSWSSTVMYMRSSPVIAARY